MIFPFFCKLFWKTWPTFADNNTGKHRACATCDWRWSSIDCSWTIKWSRNTENYYLGNFEQDFRNDSRVNLKMVSDDENVLKKVITGDESWVYGYDPETKQQSSQWKRPDEPRPKKARQSRSHVNSMLIIFFDCEGVVHYKFAPRGQTINKRWSFTSEFWKDCVMAWEENDRVSGQAVTGFFTTITRQRIHRTLCSNFWRNTRFYSFASLRTVPT